jgi:hypothetical protein
VRRSFDLHVRTPAHGLMVLLDGNTIRSPFAWTKQWPKWNSLRARLLSRNSHFPSELPLITTQDGFPM